MKDTHNGQAPFETEAARRIFRTMLLIRLFEEKAAELVRANTVKCPVHLCIGQEAISAGVCESLGPTDTAFSTHRSHGHYLAKGGDVRALMAELFGKSTGASRGHGGSMHVCQPAVGFMGSSAIVAGTIPIAVGTALSAKMRGSDSIGVAFFGDGATDEGVFYESLNFAALKKLPMLFVCENNSFSTHLPDTLRQSNPVVHERIAGFGIESRRVDGNDAMSVYREAKDLIQRARRGEGPALLECMTFRWLAHVGADEDVDIGFRKKELIESWKARCPIVALVKELIRRGTMSAEEVQTLRQEIGGIIDDAVRFAERSEYPELSEIGLGV